MGLTKFISAFRIAHRLPGRIRIYIPVLEKLPEDWREFVKPLTELITMRNGVKTVDIQPVTGSLLIDYDPGQMDENGILKWLETLVAGFLEIQTPSDRLSKANISLRFALLRNRLTQNGTFKDID
ncbi:hypothetical protein JY97_09060 [Alkalispirochaeta odontotermitis]|nr:hypothetical protein JY97_09060 [Alkalispirochaeta odontotermitis]CAB1074024.1 hypothetical protein D1AOALGA4SA_2012 [Olavius algarvensis Delta 1 endosymbiont]